MAEAETMKTVVTQRVETVPGDPNRAIVQIVAMPWWQIIGVRVARVYLMTVVGLLGGGATGVISSIDLKTAFLGAIGAAVISMLVNSIELLARLDQTNPQIRA